MMTFTTTIDTRTHSLGDLVMVTGSFTNSGASDNTGGDIVLTNFLKTVLAAGANGDAAGATDVEVNDATLTLVCAAGLDGTWFAIGRR